MDWMQVLTILGATVGSTYIFYMITEKRIDRLDEALIRIDEKWERLFERLLIQDKK